MQRYSSWFLVSGDSPPRCTHALRARLCVCTHTANDSWIIYADCMQSSHVPLQFSLACSFVTIFHRFPRGLRGENVHLCTSTKLTTRRLRSSLSSLFVTIASLIPLSLLPLFLHSFSQTSLDSPPRFSFAATYFSLGSLFPPFSLFQQLVSVPFLSHSFFLPLFLSPCYCLILSLCYFPLFFAASTSTSHGTLIVGALEIAKWNETL